MPRKHALEAVCDPENCSQSYHGGVYCSVNSGEYFLHPMRGGLLRKSDSERESQNRNSVASFGTIFRNIKCFQRSKPRLRWYSILNKKAAEN